MNYAIVTAGGRGTRFQGSLPKQLHPVGGKALLAWALSPFLQMKEMDEIIVVVPFGDDETPYREIVGAERRSRLVQGGSTRYESVRNGFESIQHADVSDPVLIHDAARPFLSRALVQRVLQTVKEKGTAVPVWAVAESVKKVDQGKIIATIPREHLYFSQTPQGFRYGILKEAYERQISAGAVTDESSLVEQAGFEVAVVEGEKRNFKITEPSDIVLAEIYVRESGCFE